MGGKLRGIQNGKGFGILVKVLTQWTILVKRLLSLLRALRTSCTGLVTLGAGTILIASRAMAASEAVIVFLLVIRSSLLVIQGVIVVQNDACDGLD